MCAAVALVGLGACGSDEQLADDASDADAVDDAVLVDAAPGVDPVKRRQEPTQLRH